MQKLSLDEWRKEGRRLLKEGYSVDEIIERIGKHNGDHRLEPSKSQGIKFRDKGVKARRLELEKVPESLRALFPEGLDPKDPNSFETYRASVQRDKIGIDQRTRQATEDSGIKYNKGHGQSAATGGPTSSRNLDLENGSRNSSHGATNPNRAALLNIGTATSWKEDAINYQDPSGLPLELSPYYRQMIRNTPEHLVDEVTAMIDKQVWERIGQNPNARPIRTNPNPQVVNPPTKQNFQGLTIDKSKPGIKIPPASRKLAKKALAIVPIAGAVDALSRSAAAAQKGDYATSAVHVAEAVVGELPGGDAVIESVTGTGVADGTLEGQRLRELQIKQRQAQAAARAKVVREDPTQERGYETIQRVWNEGTQMVGGWLKQLGIK